MFFKYKVLTKKIWPVLSPRLMQQPGTCMTIDIVPFRVGECPWLWPPTGSNLAEPGRRTRKPACVHWTLCSAGSPDHCLWMETIHPAWNAIWPTDCRHSRRQRAYTLMERQTSLPCLTDLLLVFSWSMTVCALARQKTWVWGCCCTGSVPSTTILPSLWWRAAGMEVAPRKQRMLSICTIWSALLWRL